VSDHGCLTDVYGRVACWGSDTYDRMGVIDTLPSALLIPERFTRISAGSNHTCALNPGGEVVCWGDNGGLKSGHPSAARLSFPTVVAGAHGTQIAAGGGHTCVVDGEVKCWGSAGVLGDGTNAARADARPVTPSISNVFQLVAGNNFTCALGVDGHIQCWGFNESGQLGNGNSSPAQAPVNNLMFGSGGEVAGSMTAGAAHACAVRSSDNTAWCWGANGSGQLGGGTTGGSSSTPVQVLKRNPRGLPTALTGVRSVNAGGQHTCAAMLNGTALCWGNDAFGQLGDGTQTTINVAVPVQRLTNAVEVLAAEDFSCARRDTLAVVCWGNSARAGNGLGGSQLTPTADAIGVGEVTRISALSQHVCVEEKDHTTRCWGADGAGQLGLLRTVNGLP